MDACHYEIFFCRAWDFCYVGDVKQIPGRIEVRVVSQLAVFLANKPGTLARVCEALAEEKINILAITASDTTDHTVLRMVLSDPQRALYLIEERGTLAVENEVILIEGANEPGSLAWIATRLGQARVNIDYCYSATSPDSKRGLMVMRVSNVLKAVKAISSGKRA